MILEHVNRSGGLEYTREVLEALYTELQREIGRLEEEFGAANLELRIVTEMLRV